MKALLSSLLIPILACVPAFAGEGKPTIEQIEANLRKKGEYEYNLVGRRLLRPIDEVLFKRLAEHPEENADHDYPLSSWIQRAGLEGGKKYLWLLEAEALREDPAFRADILAFEYNVTDKAEVLDKLLELVRKEVGDAGGWDNSDVLALSAVNEWKKTKELLVSLDLSADGAGGDAIYAFWLERRHFFPDNREFPKDYRTFLEIFLGSQP